MIPGKYDPLRIVRSWPGAATGETVYQTSDGRGVERRRALCRPDCGDFDWPCRRHVHMGGVMTPEQIEKLRAQANEYATKAFTFDWHKTRDTEFARLVAAHVLADDDRVSVPREPTEAMIAAMCQAHTECKWPDDFGASAIQVRTLHARKAWDAALAVAEKEKGS